MKGRGYRPHLVHRTQCHFPIDDALVQIHGHQFPPGRFVAGNAHWFLWVVLAFGGLNTVFSLFYYVKVLKEIFMGEPTSETQQVAVPALAGAYVLLITLPIFALGMSPLQGDLSATAQYVASVLFN